MQNDWIDYLMGGLITAFISLILIICILFTTYIISPERYESIQHNNNIELKVK